MTLNPRMPPGERPKLRVIDGEGGRSIYCRRRMHGICGRKRDTITDDCTCKCHNEKGTA